MIRRPAPPTGIEFGGAALGAKAGGRSPCDDRLDLPPPATVIGSAIGALASGTAAVFGAGAPLEAYSASPRRANTAGSQGQ